MVEYLKSTSDVKLRFPEMEKESFQLQYVVGSGYIINRDRSY